MHFFLGFLIPTAFLFAGALGKKLVSRIPHWEWPDVYLGVELTLAAVTVSTVNLCDLYKLDDKTEAEMTKNTEKAQTVKEREDAQVENRVLHRRMRESRREGGRNVVCLAIAVLAFLFVGTLHRQWDGKPDTDTQKRWLLAGAANFCGYFVMVLYMLWVKGID